MTGCWTLLLPSLATSPFRDTTLPGRQVGGARQPSLDVGLSIKIMPGLSN